MPAVTPPPDRILPSLTMRPSSTMAPKTGRNSRHAQWQAARRPVISPAAPNADRSQVARGRSKPGDLFDESIVLDGVDAATASRHQKDVTRLDDRQVFQI